MKRVVTRERNKTYYRVLHLPIWIWVFFILPGHLTYDLFVHGPDWRHSVWLACVTAVCAWRGAAGRLPGVEPKPYITHFGMQKANLPYRVVCYTAAWIDLLVPYTLNFIGLLLAAATGRWMVEQIYLWFYYPAALGVVAATFLDVTPRARRTTANEGAEWAWFYVALWTIVPSELAGWAMWRLGPQLGFAGDGLTRARVVAFITVGLLFFVMGFKGRLGRTRRYYPQIQAET